MDKLRKRINNEIKTHQVRLINNNGEQIGIVSTDYALMEAKKLNLDLVEIQPKTVPPVVKIMNYGKFKFAVNKKKNIAKKKQRDLKIKEIKFRPNTGNNDYLIKIKNIKNFLHNGNKAKLTICFKGREIIHKKNGIILMNKICSDLNEFSKVESLPKFEGKNIISIIRPIKKIEKIIKRDNNDKI